VEESLELERVVTLIGDNECGLEVIRVQSDTVDQTELVRPQALCLLVEIAGGKAKVELDVGAGALAGRLAKEFPSGGAGEAVLGKLDGRLVVGGLSKALGSGLIRT
jgi:hypothetical protein